jgi:hypothetical protein
VSAAPDIAKAFLLASCEDDELDAEESPILWPRSFESKSVAEDSVEAVFETVLAPTAFLRLTKGEFPGSAELSHIRRPNEMATNMMTPGTRKPAMTRNVLAAEFICLALNTLDRLPSFREIL